MSLSGDPPAAQFSGHDLPGCPAAAAAPGADGFVVFAGTNEEATLIAATFAASPAFAANRIIAATGNPPAVPPGARLHLLGFGGGAAAAQQFALLHPRRVARLCLISADWYCLPRPDLVWPLGMAGAPADWPAFLAIPTTVIVGNRDTRVDAALSADPLITAHQGRNRLRRARIFARAVADHADGLGRPCTLRLLAVHGISGDFAGSLAEGDLIALAARALLYG